MEWPPDNRRRDELSNLNSTEFERRFFDGAQVITLEIQVLKETYDDILAVIERNAWEAEEGPRILLTLGLGYAQGQRLLQADDQERARLAERLATEAEAAIVGCASTVTMGMPTYYFTHCWATVPAEAEVCMACGAVIEDTGADIVDKYIAALRHPQAETRLRVAWLLGRMREARAVPALIAAVAAWGDHDPYVLSAAVKSLGLIGDKRAVPVLRALLAEPGVSFMARVEAAYALAAIGGEDAWAALEEAAARDSNERVRRAASDAAAKRSS